MRQLIVNRIGPGCSVQDMGRPGWLTQGLSRGGAADRRALVEGAALLGQSADLAALEVTGMGGSFGVSHPTRIALTGAPMVAQLDSAPIVWNATHLVLPGQTLTLGAVPKGVWSYLHLGGGIDVPPLMGSRSAHHAQSLGILAKDGDALPLGADKGTEVNLHLEVEDRFSGGTIRILPSAHTALFAAEDLRRFIQTTFTRDPRGNRQGVRLTYDGAPFATDGQLALISEVIVPGDIQMTGDGAPYILLPECQTTGGYPRIASVLPADLPKAAQAAAGTTLRFAFIDHADALATHQDDARAWAALRKRLIPLTRDPRDIPDLLSYQLISGVTSATKETE